MAFSGNTGNQERQVVRMLHQNYRAFGKLFGLEIIKLCIANEIIENVDFC
jgi:hypothetical protein